MTTPPIITDDMPERVRLDPDHNGYDTQVVGFADGAEDTEDWPLYIRADLARPRVKPLVWELGRPENFGIFEHTQYAEVRGLADYAVYFSAERGWEWGDHRTGDGEYVSSKEEAEAAAQAHYTRRILSALEGGE